MEPLTRSNLKALYPEHVAKAISRTVETIVSEIYKNTRYEATNTENRTYYTHGIRTDLQETPGFTFADLTPAILKRLHELFPDSKITTSKTTANMVDNYYTFYTVDPEKKIDAITINWA